MDAMAWCDEDVAFNLSVIHAGQEALVDVFSLDIARQIKYDVAMLNADTKRIGIHEIVGRAISLLSGIDEGI